MLAIVHGSRAGRKSGRTTILAAALCASLLGILQMPYKCWAGSSFSLPNHIYAPASSAPTLTDSPIGAASIVFSADTWGLSDVSGRRSIAFIGASSDQYRVQQDDALPAGLGSVLSPDGRTLASDIGLVDLGTGHRTDYASQLSVNGLIAIPQAWSPDGKRIALATYQSVPNDPNVSDVPLWIEGISILDVKTGVIIKFTLPEPTLWLPGWEVAFSPDSSELAFQANQTIYLASIDGSVLSSFTIADGAHLAGEGAFTADGRGLLVASGAFCKCGHGYGVQWTVSAVDLAGNATGTIYTFDGAYAVRALGRWQSNKPVLAVYQAEPGTNPSLLDDSVGVDEEELVSLDYIEAVAVVVVSPGSPSVTLIPAQAGAAESLDIANEVLLDGVQRKASLPARVDHIDLLLAVGGSVLATTLVTVLVMRRRVALVPRRP